MEFGLIIALFLTVLVGLSLGVLGAGGSILILPILVYIAGIPAQIAVAMSLLVVGGTTLLGSVLQYRTGCLHLKAAVLLGTTGIIGAFFGSRLTHIVSEQVLMIIFAVLMLVAGVAMLRSGNFSTKTRQCNIFNCLILGLGIGVLTGFLGIGGGFMIVPVLVLFAGIETKKAIGSSLAIITLNSAAGLLGQLGQTSLNWGLSLTFMVLALVGIIIGNTAAKKISSQILNRVFAWFIFVVGITIVILNF